MLQSSPTFANMEPNKSLDKNKQMSHNLSDIHNLHSVGITCPICQGAEKNKKCRGTRNYDLIWCRSALEVDGYKYNASGANGEGYYVKTNRVKSADDIKVLAEARLAREKAARDLLDAKPSDGELNEILSVLNQLPLSDIDNRALLARGLSQETISRLGFATLVNGRQYPITRAAGFLDNGTYIGRSGMTCPIYNLNGRIQGFQVKTDIVGAKYVWAVTNASINQLARDKNLKSGETPITFINKGTQKVGICEGILKPIIASERLGISMIGASGGHFNQSHDQLKAILNSVPNIEVIIFPDAGALVNESVKANLNNLASIIKSLGFSPLVADSDQLYDQDGLDCDETPGLAAYNFVGAHVLASNLVTVGDALDPKARYTTRAGQTFTNLISEVVAKARGKFKHILINAVPGSGKTHAISEYITNDNSSDVIYYATSQAYPDNILLRSIDRTPRRQREIKENEYLGTLMTENNCKLADRFKVAYSKGLDANQICGLCEFASKCKKEVGDGYGFRKQFQMALQRQKILTTVQAMQLEHIEGRKNAITGIYEEAGVLAWTLDTNISSDNIHKQLSVLRGVKRKVDDKTARFLSDLSDLLLDCLESCSKGNLYGFTGQQLKEYFQSLALIDMTELTPLIITAFEEDNKNKFMHNDIEGTESPWILDFIEFLSGNTDILFYGNNTQLIRKKRNANMLACIERQNMNIYLDATLSKQELADKLRVSLDDIIEIRIADEDYSNVEMIRLNLKGNNLLPEHNEVIQQAINNLQATNPNALFGIIDSKVRKDDIHTWDRTTNLIHMSDARGSNAFQTKDIVVSVGDSRRNLGAVLAEYCVIQGVLVDFQDAGFKAYNKSVNNSDIKQEIGRLRNERRRQESLKFILISDRNNMDISGIDFTVMEPEELSIRAKRRGEALYNHIKQTVIDLARLAQKTTQRAVARALETTITTVQRLAAKHHGNWKTLLRDVLGLTEALIAKDKIKVQQLLDTMPEFKDVLETVENPIEVLLASIPKPVVNIVERHIAYQYRDRDEDVPTLKQLMGAI